MIVCIAEKPSVARDIAAVLGATQKYSGYIQGNGYQVTWVFGHLCSLKEPHDYRPEWKRWNIGALPMIPDRFGIKLIENEGSKKQFGVIERLVKEAEMVVNCGDAGQEGELIQRWVLQKAGCQCPVKRLWISSLTEESIRNGFASLKEEKEFQSLYEAGLMRAIGDWLLGMNGTRLYTVKYRAQNEKMGREKQLYSVGRVQTPTLALIVDRQREIDEFIPVPYWEVKTKYREVIFSAAKGRYNSVEEGQEALSKILESPFAITSIADKKGEEAPPRLFDLTSLQVECNKKFNFSADETLKTIQSLYEKKLTTYPRVDTTFLSDDIYPKCPTILRNIGGFDDFTKPLLELSKLPKSKKVFDTSKVTDHHAIIPTEVRPITLTIDERKVYNLVAQRFIGAFYPNCKFNTTTVMGESGGVEFKTTGKTIIHPGWRVLYEKVTDEEKEDEIADKASEGILPPFVKGESGPHEPSLAEKATTPPKLYTEATLLRAMETAGKLVDDEELREAMKENGIGRPSTRAAIIETLFARGFVIRQKKNLVPTEIGKELIELIDVELLKSAELTGRWEKKLREINKGSYSAAQFLQELKAMIWEIVDQVKRAK